MIHYDPTQRCRCSKAVEGDSFCSRNGTALLYVDCPSCIQKTSFKRLKTKYEIVDRNGIRCVRSKDVY